MTSSITYSMMSSNISISKMSSKYSNIHVQNDMFGEYIR